MGEDERGSGAFLPYREASGRGTTRGVVEGASLGVPPNQGAAARRLAAEASAAETVPGYALPKWVRT